MVMLLLIFVELLQHRLCNSLKIIGLTQKAAFACGSKVLYVYGVSFFAPQGEKGHKG
jgi:hypothetical protein